MEDLTTEQRQIVNRAIELIEPFAEKEVAEGGYFFRDKKGDELSSEYDCCDNPKCYEKAKKEARSSIGKYARIEAIYTWHDGDNNSIDRCCICNKPLNESLTWIRDEFDHHKRHSITLEVIKEPTTAFDIKCMLEAMPSCDNEINQYAKYQNDMGNPTPMKEQQERADEFVKEVVEYATLIITLLTQAE